MRARLGDGLPEGAELFRVRTAQAGKGTLDLLKGLGRECRLLASNQSPPEQARTEAWFASAERPSLVVVGALPLPERRDVRSLYVMNLPPTLRMAEEDIAAAGRDGLDASVEFFASATDREARLREIEKEYPAEARARQRERVNLCISWIENDGCARVFLARHLRGETVGVCGNCGWCVGRKSVFIPEED